MNDLVVKMCCPICKTVNNTDPKSNPVFQCDSCGAQYPALGDAWNFLSKEIQSTVMSSFESLAEDGSKTGNKTVGYRFSGHYKSVQSLNRLMCGNPSGKIILDAGCGHGDLSHVWANDNKVVGVDISPSMVALANQRGIEGHLAQIDILPFESGTFDIIVCCGVVQYYEDPIQVLKEFSRVIKKGGRLVIDTLSSKSFLRRLFRFVSGNEFPFLSDKLELARLARLVDLEVVRYGYTYAPLSNFFLSSDNEGLSTVSPWASNFSLELRKL